MSSSGCSANRLDSYKSKGLLRSDQFRRRREDQQVEIRRQQRDETNAKRRQMNIATDLTDDEAEDEDAVSTLLEGATVRIFPRQLHA